MSGATTADFLGGGGQLGASAAKAPPLTAEQVARAAVARDIRNQQVKSASDAAYLARRAADQARSDEFFAWWYSTPEGAANRAKQHSAGIDWGLLPAAAKITAALVATAATGGLAAPAFGTLYEDAQKIAASLSSPETAIATAQDAVAAVEQARARAAELQTAALAYVPGSAAAPAAAVVPRAAASAVPIVTVRSSAAPAPVATGPAPVITSYREADAVLANAQRGRAGATGALELIRAAAAAGDATARKTSALLEAVAATRSGAGVPSGQPTPVPVLRSAAEADAVLANAQRGRAGANLAIELIRAAAAAGDATARSSLALLERTAAPAALAQPAGAPAPVADSPEPEPERGFVVTAIGRILEGSEWIAAPTGAGVWGTLIRTTGPAALRIDATDRHWRRNG